MAGPHKNVRLQVRGTALSTGELRVKTIYNTYDFVTAAIVGSPSKAGILAAFKAAILTPLAACLSVSYVKNAVDIRYIDDPLDPYQTFIDGVNGGVTGDSLPSVNNVTIQLKSGVRGRTWMGSKHFGPIAESHTTLDYLNSTAIALWAAFQTAYLAGFTDASGTVWKPFIVSQYYSVFNPTTAAVVGVNVTSTIVNAYLGIMRKRAQERTNTM